MLRQLIQDVRHLLQDRDGFTAVEYAAALALLLLGGLIATLLLGKSTTRTARTDGDQR